MNISEIPHSGFEGDQNLQAQSRQISHRLDRKKFYEKRFSDDLSRRQRDSHALRNTVSAVSIAAAVLAGTCIIANSKTGSPGENTDRFGESINPLVHTGRLVPVIDKSNGQLFIDARYGGPDDGHRKATEKDFQKLGLSMTTNDLIFEEVYGAQYNTSSADGNVDGRYGKWDVILNPDGSPSKIFVPNIYMNSYEAAPSTPVSSTQK